MGCFCSKEDEEVSSRLNRPAQASSYPRVIIASSYNYSVTNDNNIPRHNTVLRSQRNREINYEITKRKTDVTPKIGEYKCVCGRFWTSRYCWPDKYQNCKKCKRPVYAHKYRELKPSDNVKDDDDQHPHEKELCQMCQQLGHSCTTKRSKRLDKKIY